MGMELLWRSWSHGSMFVVGGICFLLIGGIDGLIPDMPLVMQSVLGACLVTAVELISGLILNLWLDMGVWDYSDLPLNFMGQVCMAYFFLWILVSLLGVLLEDQLRQRLFREPPVAYRVL